MAVQRFWDRDYVLEINGKRISGLAISFDVTKTRTAEPNTAEITIHNMTEERRNSLTAKKRTPITLEAGYRSKGDNGLNFSEKRIEYPIVFKGKIRRAVSHKEKTTWTTTIVASDGAFEISDQYNVPIKIGEGTSIEDAAKKFVDSLGFGSSDQSALHSLYQKFKEAGGAKGFVKFVRGFSITKAYDELVELGKSLALDISVQNETVQAIGRGKALDIDPHLIDADHGLLGSPSVGEDGAVTLRTYLRPEIGPAHPVQVGSNWLNGTYVVEQLQHVGESRGPAWHTILELRPL